MHDNKTIGKKLTTYLWFVLTWMPVITMIVMIIGYFMGNGGISTLTDLKEFKNGFVTFLGNEVGNVVRGFGNYSIQAITTTLSNVLNAIGVTGTASVGILAIIFGHAISWMIYHLIFDLLTMFFNLAHNFLGKIGG